MCMVCEPHGWSLRVVTLVWGVCGSNEGRFGHSERAVRMGCGKRENGVRTAVGGVGQCVWCGSSEDGVWEM